MSTEDVADVTETEAPQAEDAEKQSNEAPATLEEQGEIAADYLEELLDIADLDGDIDIDVIGGRPHLEVLSEGETGDLKKLVGRNGEVLSALQELTRLAVLASTGSRSMLMLDIAKHRDQLRGELQQRAADAIAEVKESGEAVACKPMNSFERKVIHDAAAEAGLRSESEGAGASRHVVIHPDGA